MSVLERLLRSAAVMCSLIVVAGWGWFAIDETAQASTKTQQEIAGRAATQTVDPSPDLERSREKVQGSVHEGIDDANDVLLRPFTAVVDGQPSKWMRRTVPAVLALMVYGFGLGLLARFLANQ